MKKVFNLSHCDKIVVNVLMGVIALSLLTMCMTACSRDDGDNGEAAVNIALEIPSDTIQNHVTITFDFGGNAFSLQPMTRASLSDLTMTDLWVFDYIGDALMQTVHQASTDTGFGSPALSLEYGEHTFYFVASRGSDPTIETDAGTIVWSAVRDTFHGSLSMNVQPTSGSSQAVSLSRCVGRLRISATDVVPTGAAKLTVSPSAWYSGLNYKTGEAVGNVTTPLSVNIPDSYIGTTNLAASFYTISGSAAWQMDVVVALIASDESTIGSVAIPDVPIVRNHITSYSGGIVGAGRSLSVTSNDEWVEDTPVNW